MAHSLKEGQETQLSSTMHIKDNIPEEGIVQNGTLLKGRTGNTTEFE